MQASYTSLLLALTLSVGLASPTRAQKEFEPSKDAFAQAGVPQGVMHQYQYRSKAGVFPGTIRDVWVYIPAQYVASKPAALMVFQDGGGYTSRDGGYRFPTILDNLIAHGEMPVTIAIMANPGAVPPADDKTQLPRYNRSVEYDGVDDRFATFLIDELIPDAVKRYKLNISPDPRAHAISGGSSGGIAAFTAAWERPDYFGKVLGFISSFTDLRGGHNYPSLIRKLERKPIRVFLEEAVNDQDIYSGSWPIGNTDVAAALEFAGYDYKYQTGPGGHDGRFAGAIFPDALKWLWRDGDNGSPKPKGSRQPLLNIALDESKEWSVVPGIINPTAMAGTVNGTLFVAHDNKVSSVSDSGALTQGVWQGVGTVRDLASCPDGSIIAVTTKKTVLSLQTGAAPRVLHRGLDAVAVTVRQDGSYYLLGSDGKVWFSGADNKKQLVTTTTAGAATLQLTPDQSLLIVSPPANIGRYATSWSVAKDGVLNNMQTYFDLYIPYGDTGSGVSDFGVDRDGWLYASSTIGVQILDQAGRVNAILASPVRKATGSIAFGGKGLKTLYHAAGGKLFSRVTRATGAVSDSASVRPPGPRL